MVFHAAMDPSNELHAPEPESTIEPRLAGAGFGLSRGEATLTNLLSRASEAWSKDLGTWVLAILLSWLLGTGVPVALSLTWGFISAFQESGAEASLVFKTVNVIVQVLLYGVQLALSAVFSLGLWAMALRGLSRESVTVGVLFSQLSKIWKYILQLLAVALGGGLIILPIVVVIFLVFVGPVDLQTPMNEIMDDAGVPLLVSFVVLLPLYVYLLAGIAFMQAELALNDDAGPIEAIVNSWRIAQGKRWRIVGVGLVVGLITSGSAMMCGIGLLFGAPFATLLFGALYLGLRNGADVPSPNTATTLGRQY